ncbi:unnamed protein product [Didymodactylos carnosus]|uniref:Uncharacterized protein n=1 Tax=Didymodactylos carnosus TaxID=1234261 RepID=A0A8S2D6I2_9BILA|nr:unnamed protein product [Didymodactylos carnosus]CAF3641069.1 unnamed protein product [Didymodactylos carnosus]
MSFATIMYKIITMMSFIQFLLVSYYVDQTNSFLTLSVNSTYTTNIITRNISCYYGTISGADNADRHYTPSYGNYQYCVLIMYYSNGNLPQQIDFSSTAVLNTYRRMSERCRGFSNTTDVGYGYCSPLSYETVVSLFLCICATSNCNNNLQTCQLSVSMVQPAPLATFLPYLSTSISCQDSGYISSNRYTYCQELDQSINYTACNDYMETNTVLCSIWSLTSENSTSSHQVAYPPENYEKFLLSTLYNYLTYVNTSTYNESSSSLFVQDGIQNFTYISCYCISNYCNANFSSCTVDTAPTTSSTITSRSSSNGSSLSDAAIAGIVIGVIVGAIVIGAIVGFISYHTLMSGRSPEENHTDTFTDGVDGTDDSP